MKKARFVRVDVFTRKPFGGNPLAVFPDAKGLTPREMQLLAMEMNLSETTFVVPPTRGSGADFRVRIFVPDREIPYAGHPTLGTFFVLASEGRIRLRPPVTTVKMESLAGVLPVEIHSSGRTISKVVTVQNRPEFGKVYRDDELETIARAVSLASSDVADKASAQLVSTGLPWVILPVRNRKAVERASGSAAGFAEAAKLMPKDVADIYVTCLDPVEKSSTTHSRGFSLVNRNIVEDPATGSASGCLGAFLVHWGLVRAQPVTRMVNEQGYEIGRRSRIEIAVGTKGSDEIDSVRVGGPVVHMMDGHCYV
jgi:trans-2,3-dihydro-3-hydroxyanthranilate isomerase